MPALPTAPQPIVVGIVQGTAQVAGAERQLLAQLVGLDRDEVRARVLLFGDGPLVGLLAATGLNVTQLGVLPRAREPRSWRRVVQRIAAAAEGTDLLHAQGEKLVPFAAAAARRAGVPLVRHLHDRPARSTAALGLHVAGRVIRTPGATVVPSAAMRDQLGRLGVDARLLPNGLDLRALPGPLPRAALGVPEDAVLIVLAGRLQRWKGQAEAIRALAVARWAAGGAAPLHLLLLGDALYGLEPDFPAELRRLVAELGIGDAVTFAGHRDDALAVIAAADIVLHASLEPEPFGMVVLEGMAQGRAVVAAGSGGPVELIDHGRTGLLVAPGDVDGIAGALVTLAGDPARRAELGAAARLAVEDRFSAPAIGKAWAATYRAVLSAP